MEKNGSRLLVYALSGIALALAGALAATGIGGGKEEREKLRGDLGRLAGDLRGIGEELAAHEKARRESVVLLAGALAKLDGNIDRTTEALELAQEYRGDIESLGRELAEARCILDGIAERTVGDAERLTECIGEAREIGGIVGEDEDLAGRGREGVRELAQRLGISLPKEEP